VKGAISLYGRSLRDELIAWAQEQGFAAQDPSVLKLIDYVAAKYSSAVEKTKAYYKGMMDEVKALDKAVERVKPAAIQMLKSMLARTTPAEARGG